MYHVNILSFAQKRKKKSFLELVETMRSLLTCNSVNILATAFSLFFPAHLLSYIFAAFAVFMITCCMPLLDSKTISSLSIVGYHNMGENRKFGQVSQHAFVTTPFFSLLQS